MNDGPKFDERDHEGDQEAPARLSEALWALGPRPPAVPPEVDASILERARAHLATAAQATPNPQSLATLPRQSQIGNRKSQIPTIPRWLAMAAAFAVGVGLVFLLRRDGAERPSMVREDIDRNGRVDILDAFALARKLQAGGASGGVGDVNGDGAIDQRDIDWIAARAVRLPKG